MKKKVIAVALIAMLATTTLTGCTSNKTETTESSNNSVSETTQEGTTQEGTTQEGTTESVSTSNPDLTGNMPIFEDPSKCPEMTMLFVDSPERVIKVEELEQTKRLTKETGVSFIWKSIPGEGSGEKINLMLSSGDLPDVFWNGISNSMVVQYMDQNVFLPTEDLVKNYMPLLRGVYAKRPHYEAQATAPDGHTYGFPYIEEMQGLVLTPGPFLINTKWLEKVGKPMPTTVDEWVDCLRAFRDADDINESGEDDTVPYSFGITINDAFSSFNTLLQFTGAFGQPSTGMGLPTDYFTVKNDEIVFTGNSEAYKKTLSFFYDLNQEKLIDPNSFSTGATPNQPLYLDTIKEDVAKIGSFGVWAPINQITNFDVYNQYAPMPRLKGESGYIGSKVNFSEMHNTSMTTITTVCKYPEIVAAFTDHLFDPELSITTNWGAVGEGFVYNKGEDGILHFNLDEEGKMILPNGYTSFGELRTNTTPVRGSMAILDEYYGTVADYTYDAIDLLAYQKVNGKDDILKEQTSVPMMLFTTEEQNKIAQIQPQIIAAVNNYTMQFVLDGGIESNWDTYLSDLESAGLADLTLTLQGAYDRYLENMAK